MPVQTQNPGSASTRAQREKEALRQMWEAIAWGSAFVATVFPFLLGHWLSEDDRTVIFLIGLAGTAYACFKLGDNLATSVSMRLNVFLVIMAAALMFALTFGLFGYLTLYAMITSITDWYVRKFP